MTSQPPTVTVAELADGVLGATALGDRGDLVAPVLVVDLDGAEAGAVDAAAEVARRSDAILVGRRADKPSADLTPLLTALDLTYGGGSDERRETIPVVDVEQAVIDFTDAVANRPQASVVVAQVIRASESLPVPAAIDVESLGYSTLQGGAEFGGWLEERRALGRPLPPPPTADPVLVDRRAGQLRITLNRPERRNAYGVALRDAFVEALRIPLLDNSIDSIVVDGAGPCFCAGGDLDEFGHTPDLTTAHIVRTRGGAGRLVARLADRIEFRLHGQCVGAGIEIPAFAGRVVAAPDTVMRLPEVTMGLLPGAGGTVSIPRRIGRWRALHLFVIGAPISADEALAWGLVDVIG
ncbi:enoyl-CoA hydratase/isomerase family protein [Gordonia sp. HNM0687]|uniref:Enoyl-CoA hydratase/isomerase family protein n=1 Tax=Gordonia mangrovi TaxID=2665643 RepID=A0A6L7GKL3_9ACTN|nr:enoyl-CoA hydratase/isomerase family protein [Gordonia mangrovi]MXP19751.1 enoyl-CoA hydratase/isomerase family protein [Gordonia mangrovi]UVF79619.1 enoyl-CoA hydratase/isomerase family protein [Gordonia mangrovi]